MFTISMYIIIPSFIVIILCPQIIDCHNSLFKNMENYCLKVCHDFLTRLFSTSLPIESSPEKAEKV